MDKRHSALDGLRGFAALSVFFAHAGFNIAVLTTIPIFTVLFSTLSVGTNAVQILFVLSGFLMAYLYSDETRAFHFIRKRYTRIFPLYIVIMMYLWILSFAIGVVSYAQLLILLGIVVIFHLGWRIIRKLDSRGKFRTLIFSGFVLFQILLIIFLIVSGPRFGRLGGYPQILTGLSNLSLTTDFVSGISRLSNQAWSLVPEVLFYILFPFIAIPLITLAKKRGIFVGILLVLGMTKILFDLDTAFYSIADLQSMNIARASGFIAGIVMGIVYKSQGKIWSYLEKIFSNSLAGIGAFIIFLYIQWRVGQAIASGNSSITDLNFYYLLSGWVIAFVIAAVILPNTVMNKIFRYKIIAFFGVISYSVYLIHTSMLQISGSMTNYLTPYISSRTFLDSFSLLLGLALTIVISYILFRFIESLYFIDKKHLHSKAIPKVTPKVVVHTPSKIRLLWIGIGVLGVIFLLYSGNYPSSLLVARNAISSNTQEVSITQKHLLIPFTAHYDNLSEVVILLRYTNTGVYSKNIKHPRQLVFYLYNAKKSKLLFESKRTAWQVTGQLRFPFGFTTQTNSQNKKYIVEISTEGPQNGEGIEVNTSSTSFVSIYTYPQSKLKMLPTLIMNRAVFVLTNPDAQFAIAFLVFVLILEILPVCGIYKSSEIVQKPQ